MQRCEDILKGYQDNHTPFKLVDNTKKEEKESQTMSTSELKGVDTMKKHCYKRTDGRWQYSKQENGYRYYTIANTYRELIEKIKEIEPKPVKSIKNFRTKSKNDEFIQFYQSFIDNYIKTKNIKEKSMLDWQRQLDKDIATKFRNIKLNELTTEKIQKFINSITEERKQELIYQRIIKVLHKAYATGKLKRDITLGLEKPQRKNIQERPPLTLHEQINLLKVAKNTKLYTYIIFSIVIGSRREETLRFNLSTDINEKKLQIHIKGTKRQKSDRYVKTTKEFIEFLKKNMNSPTFQITLDEATHDTKELMKKAGINNCLHSLRHTCSANLYFLGANDKYRQMQLGHASVVTTNDIYTNIKENISKHALRLIYGHLYPDFD